jgi:hypothetical protein
MSIPKEPVDPGWDLIARAETADGATFQAEAKQLPDAKKISVEGMAIQPVAHSATGERCSPGTREKP